MQDNSHNLHHIFIRVVVPDFGAWYREHVNQAKARATYGLRDGPIYRELDNPNAALVRLDTNDVPKALKWVKPSEFREACLRTQVQAREFYDTAWRKMRRGRYSKPLRFAK